MPPSRADDAELELPVGDELDDRLRVVHLECDLHVGVAVLELAQEQRHDDGRRAGGGADRELAGQRTCPLRRHLAEQLLLELQQPLRSAVEAPARLGRLDAPAGAVEQLGSEALLERPHLQRHGGLGDAEPVGRLREAAALDDGAEGCELPCVHKQILSRDVRAANPPGAIRTYA